MFSGIIKGIGEIASYDKDNFRLTLRCPLFANGVELGASIAVDGVCLTACQFDDHHADVVVFDLGEETRNKTLLAKKNPRDLVNIEFSLRMGDYVDGHMVQGHVDGLAQVVEKVFASTTPLLRFSLPPSLAPFVAQKGAIAVNGVSLTINELDAKSFSVCLVPYTVANTSFKYINVGDYVHIETDMVGRYLHRLITVPKLVEDAAA